MDVKKKAIVFYCIDPRFATFCCRFVEEELGQEIAFIFPWPGSLPLMDQKLQEILFHQIEQLLDLGQNTDQYEFIVIGHQDCGAYKLFRKLFGHTAIDTQKSELQVQKYLLKKYFPKINCRWYYMEIINNMVKFDQKLYHFKDFHEVEYVVLIPAEYWQFSQNYIKGYITDTNFDLLVYFSNDEFCLSSRFVCQYYIDLIRSVCVDVHHAKKMLFVNNSNNFQYFTNKVKEKIPKLFIDEKVLLTIDSDIAIEDVSILLK